MTMTSFAITRYGQCCRRHVVSQSAVSDISVVGRCLCSASNNANLFIRLLIAVLGTFILLHIASTT